VADGACRLLGVLRSGYYEWKGGRNRARVARDNELLKLIERLHVESRGNYGSPGRGRVAARPGRRGDRKRVERLMQQTSIQGMYRRCGWKNVVNTAIEEDLVRRNFTVTPTGQTRVAD
jgi:putative transposase